MTATIPTDTTVTVWGITKATVLAPDYGTRDDETVLVGYILEDTAGRCFTAPLNCVKPGAPTAWATAN